MTRTPQQVMGAAIAGFTIGFAGGASLGAGIDGVGAPLAGLVGGVATASMSAWADVRRVPGRVQPIWVRVLTSSLLAAVLGWLAELVLPAWPAWVVAVLAGVGAGLIGMRPSKIAVGLAVAIAAAWLFESVPGEFGWSVVSAVVVLVYRVVAAVIYRGRDQIDFLAERADPGQVPFVVPLAEQHAYVGVDYLKRYAERAGASFERNPADIGIIDSLDQLAGPDFDPSLAHPSIREFYEHTSRFRLSITPHWRPWMRVPYLLYRSAIAAPLGQANAPFSADEVHDGVISWIDTIDLDGDGVPDFRAWVRAYEASMEPLYVGIYTVVRHGEVGYVSVGFPLPAGSFTATLLPRNNRGDGLLLSSRAGSFQGHYLSLTDAETGELSVARLNSFDEDIDVFVENERLVTDHRFYIGGIEFMYLHYDIDRH